jgi:hypothetical protein
MKDKAMASETLDVEFKLTGIERIAGGGKLAALANVEVDIGGVVIGLQGCQVRRDAAGALSVVAPMFRSSDGVWRSAVVLPDSLRDALGSEILEHLEVKQ